MLIKRYIVVYSILYHTFRHKTKYIKYMCVYLHTGVYLYTYICVRMDIYLGIYAHAVSAFGGKALLGIKCINLFFCARVYYCGEADSVQLDKDTNGGKEG